MDPMRDPCNAVSAASDWYRHWLHLVARFESSQILLDLVLNITREGDGAERSSISKYERYSLPDWLWGSYSSLTGKARFFRHQSPACVPGAIFLLSFWRFIQFHSTF